MLKDCQARVVLLASRNSLVPQDVRRGIAVGRETELEGEDCVVGEFFNLVEGIVHLDFEERCTRNGAAGEQQQHDVLKHGVVVPNCAYTVRSETVICNMEYTVGIYTVDQFSNLDLNKTRILGYYCIYYCMQKEAQKHIF